MADVATHPMRFPPDHPLTVRVRGLCMSYPEAAEVLSHGRSTFRAGKRQFAIVGAAADILLQVRTMVRSTKAESRDDAGVRQ